MEKSCVVHYYISSIFINSIKRFLFVLKVNQWRQWNKVSEGGKLFKHPINILWSKLSQVWVTDWKMSAFVILNTRHILVIYGYVEDTCRSFCHSIHFLIQIPLYGPCQTWNEKQWRLHLPFNVRGFCHSFRHRCLYHKCSLPLYSYMTGPSWKVPQCSHERGNGGELPWVGKKWY